MSEDIVIYDAALEAAMQGETSLDLPALAADENAAPPVSTLSSETHPEILKLWATLPTPAGQPYPSTRAMATALRAAGVKISTTNLAAQLQRLRASALAQPSLPDAVAQAEERLAKARQAAQAVATEFVTTEAQVAQLDPTVATLIAKASAGGGEAALAIPETKETLKLTLRTLEVQLPLAQAHVAADVKAAEQALKEACTARDIADYNRLAAGEAVLDQAVMDATDVLHERLVARLSHALAQRTIAGRLTIPLGEPHAAPERRLASYVLGRLADVAPPYPQRVGSRMPAVDDLVETSTTNRPITAAEVQTMQGKGQVWVVYRGTQNISWAGCTPRPPQTQAALQAHHPVEMSLHDYAVLRDRYGEAILIVPPPTWEP